MQVGIDRFPEHSSERRSVTAIVADLPVDAGRVDEHVLERLPVGGLAGSLYVSGRGAGSLVETGLGQDDVAEEVRDDA